MRLNANESTYVPIEFLMLMPLDMKWRAINNLDGTITNCKSFAFACLQYFMYIVPRCLDFDTVRVSTVNTRVKNVYNEAPKCWRVVTRLLFVSRLLSQPCKNNFNTYYMCPWYYIYDAIKDKCINDLFNFISLPTGVVVNKRVTTRIISSCLYFVSQHPNERPKDRNIL